MTQGYTETKRRGTLKTLREIFFAITPARYAQETGLSPTVRQPTLPFAVNVDTLSPTAQRVVAGITTTQNRRRGSGVWLQPHDAVAAAPLVCWHWPPLDVDESPEQYLERQVQAMLSQGTLSHFALEAEAVAPLLDTGAVARLLGVSRSLVCRWCRDQRVPAIWTGREWRVARADLAALRDRPSPGRPPRERDQRRQEVH